MTYAISRTLNPQTGDWTYTAAYTAAPSPATELVKRVLRTARGQCLLDPLLGVDWPKVDPLGTNAGAIAEVVLRAALAPLVTRGAIADVKLAVEVDAAKGRVLYTVDFADVRLRQRQTFSGAR